MFMTKDHAISWLHGDARLEYSGTRNACVALTDEIDRLEQQAKRLIQALAEVKSLATSTHNFCAHKSRRTENVLQDFKTAQRMSLDQITLVDRVLKHEADLTSAHQQKEKDANAARLSG